MRKLLNKISTMRECLRKEPELGIAILYLITTLLMGILGIHIAIQEHNYLLLSISAYFLVLMISETYVKKIFFDKFNCYLLDNPKATLLTYWTVTIILLISSLKYLTAFVFLVVLAFMDADYNKTKKAKEKEKE